MGKRDILLKAENEGALSGKEFSLLLQERIRRHPILWWLFMVG